MIAADKTRTVPKGVLDNLEASLRESVEDGWRGPTRSISVPSRIFAQLQAMVHDSDDGMVTVTLPRAKWEELITSAELWDTLKRDGAVQVAG